MDSIEQEQRGRYKCVLRELRERPQITLPESHPRVHRYEVTGNLNNNLSKMVFDRQNKTRYRDAFKDSLQLHSQNLQREWKNCRL